MTTWRSKLVLWWKDIWLAFGETKPTAPQFTASEINLRLTSVLSPNEFRQHVQDVIKSNYSIPPRSRSVDAPSALEVTAPKGSKFPSTEVDGFGLPSNEQPLSVPVPTVSDCMAVFGGVMDMKELAFARFHIDNPQVYTKLVALAKSAKDAGQKKIGIRLLWERLRWYVTVETSNSQFKLNNNHTANYAQLIMAFEPELNGFFNTRER